MRHFPKGFSSSCPPWLCRVAGLRSGGLGFPLCSVIFKLSWVSLNLKTKQNKNLKKEKIKQTNKHPAGILPRIFKIFKISKVEGVFINSFRQMAPCTQKCGAQTPAQCHGQHLYRLPKQCHPVQGTTLTQLPEVTQHSRECGAYTMPIREHPTTLRAKKST